MRRDLRELSEAGLLQRVHGGALPLTPATMGYVERQHHASEAKAAIAIAAARLVRDGQVVILDGGTTTLQVARQLAPQSARHGRDHQPADRGGSVGTSGDRDRGDRWPAL